ncbi:MAG: flippase [Candidatus Moranbacteria bacterium]|nr:flippase [Candidatus Moranbacteria bacterium]
MKNFSRALVWLTLSEIIYNISGYVIHAALGRTLGPEGYGRYGLVVTMTTMIIILIGNGIPTAMSKYLSEVFESAPDRIQGIKRKTILLQAAIMGGVTVLFFLGSPLLSAALGDPSLTPLFRLSSFIIPSFAAASFYFYYYTGLHFFRLQAALKTLRSFSRVVFIVWFAYLFGVEGAVSGYIVAPLLVFLVAWIADRISTGNFFPKMRSADSPDFPTKKLVSYAWPLTLFLLFYELVSTIDLYLIKAMLGSDHLAGLYNAAITVGRIPYYLFYALTIILLPAVSKSVSDRSGEATKALVAKAMRLLALVLFPVVTLLALYAPQVLLLFYGEKYADAATAMRIFAVGVGFLTVFYVLASAVNGAGLVKIPMYLSLGGLAFSLILNVIFIPRYGIEGAAFATTITSFILMLAMLVSVERHFSSRLSGRLWFVSTFSAVLIIALSFVLPGGRISFLVSGAILFALYFLPPGLFGVLTDDDLAPFRKLLPKG